MTQIILPKISGENIRTLKAGPSQQHALTDKEQEYVTYAAQQDHRSQFAKDLISAGNEGVFEMFGIPENLRNAEFSDFSKSPKGWHVAWTSSGTDGMFRATRGMFPEKGNLLVNTDNFSKVAGAELTAGGRNFEEMKLERGQALTVGSEKFQEISLKIQNGEINTIHLTENGTTTGVEQAEAIEELVKIRNEADADVVMVVDAVSSQMFGRIRNSENLPDVIYWGNQKDTAITSGTGNMLFNNRALARATEISEEGLDMGGKLSLQSAYGTNEKRMTQRGQTMQTPAMGLIAQQVIIFQKILEEENGREKISQMQKKGKNTIIESIRNGELADRGFSMLAEEGVESNTTQVVVLPDAIAEKRADFVNRVTEISGVAINNGYGKSGGGEKEVRICVYSANTAEDVQKAIQGMVQAADEMLEISE